MANVLVIDDDSSLLQMMSIMLKRAGHVPITAEGGKDGIALARRDPPQIIIVDVMMPDLNGYQVCSALRQDPITRNIPLLMLTALSGTDDRERAEDAGADSYVTKPVTRDDLVKHVEELLRTGARNFPEFITSADTMPSEPPPAVSPISPAEPVSFPPATSPPGFAPAQPLAETPRPADTGSLSGLPVVVVVGLGTGVGTTTLAINLALALMQFGRTCLVDLNTRGGQAAVQLRIAVRGTWLNLLRFTPGMDKRMIAATLTVDYPLGIALIAAPPTPVQDRLSATTLHVVFKTLAEGFKRIIVDLPMDMDAASIATLTEADHIVVIVGNDPADLVGVPNQIATLDALKLPGQKHVILNHTRPHGVSYESVMQAINYPLAADIPYEPAQIDAVTSGKPLLMSQPASLFTRAVLHLARQL